jgi:hypothetical protein
MYLWRDTDLDEIFADRYRLESIRFRPAAEIVEADWPLARHLEAKDSLRILARLNRVNLIETLEVSLQ